MLSNVPWNHKYHTQHGKSGFKTFEFIYLIIWSFRKVCYICAYVHLRLRGMSLEKKIPVTPISFDSKKKTRSITNNMKKEVRNSFVQGILYLVRWSFIKSFEWKVSTQTSHSTSKTDFGNFVFSESMYLVRWSFRYSFEYKVKP